MWIDGAKSIARDPRIEVAVPGLKGELPNGTLGAVARDIQFRRRTVVWTHQKVAILVDGRVHPRGHAQIGRPSPRTHNSPIRRLRPMGRTCWRGRMHDLR